MTAEIVTDGLVVVAPHTGADVQITTGAALAFRTRPFPWTASIRTDLASAADMPEGVRISTEFPSLTRRFLDAHGVKAPATLDRRADARSRRRRAC